MNAYPFDRATLRRDAARLLDELGSTAGEVGYSLYLMGVGARPWRRRDSPAVTYLQAVVGADSRVVAVSVTKRRLVMKTPRRWRGTVRVRLPRPVRDFSAAIERTRSRQMTGVRLQDGLG